MNKQRREAIEAIRQRLDDIIGEVETLKDEEQDYLDNMPENMQQGEKGSQAETAVEALTDACESINSAVDQLGEASP